MPKVAARIDKLKQGDLASSWSHVARTRETLNANPSVANIRLIDSGNADQPLHELILEKIRSSNKRKILPNANYAAEILLSASAEYFRPDDPKRSGYYIQERLDQWVQANTQWLTEQYGTNLVRAELHLDESTPHIHAYFVPLKPNGNLSYDYYFGNGKKFSEFQTQAHNAVQHLGIERGIEGSQAHHQTIKAYYEAVNEASNLVQDQVPTHVLAAKAADRDQAIAKKNQAEKTAEKAVQNNTALQADLLRYRAEIEELTSWRTQQQQMADALRTVRLDLVAEKLDLVQDLAKPNHWHHQGQVITITDSKFFNLDTRTGGGGAIDLVMAVNQCDYSQAIRWLREEFGEVAALELIKDRAARRAANKAKTIFAEQADPIFVPPTPDEEQWPRVQEYLTQQQHLPAVLINRLHKQGKLYADARQNAVFLRTRLGDRKVTGANLLGTYGEGNSFAGVAPGTRLSQGCFQLQSGDGADISRIVLLESPLDAIAYQVMDQEQADQRSGQTHYLCVDQFSRELLDHLQRSQEVVIAFHRDTQLHDLQQRILQQFPNALQEVPEDPTWSASRANHLQALAQQIAQRVDQLQQKQDEAERQKRLQAQQEQRQKLLQARNHPTTGVHRAIATYRRLHQVLLRADPNVKPEVLDPQVATYLRVLEYDQLIVADAIRIMAPRVQGVVVSDSAHWASYGSRVASYGFRELTAQEQAELEAQRQALEQLDVEAQAQRKTKRQANRNSDMER